MTKKPTGDTGTATTISFGVFLQSPSMKLDVVARCLADASDAIELRRRLKIMQKYHKLDLKKAISHLEHKAEKCFKEIRSAATAPVDWEE